MRVLIIGGTGSLGRELMRRWGADHELHVMSRDECKHWELGREHPAIVFHVGDVRDRCAVDRVLRAADPERVVLASALKHVERCEYNVRESFLTSVLGVENVLRALEQRPARVTGVCFVSTDKACSPVNTYGMCKALGEKLMVEYARRLPPGMTAVTVRYGNVLNSRGSIIPALHAAGRDPRCEAFTLTDGRMTRFVMTLEQSVDLIEHALEHGRPGEVVVPRMRSMLIADLLALFSERYDKPVRVVGIRPGEKLAEELINATQSQNVRTCGDYVHLCPAYGAAGGEAVAAYASSDAVVTRDELRRMLDGWGLL